MTEPWISLAEAKAQLNKQPNVTVDDVELGGFISAACSIVEDLKGHVVPATFTKVLPAYRDRIRCGGYYRDRWFVDLPQTPVLSVETVTRHGQLLTPVPVAAETTVPVPGPGEYSVSYTAGRAEIPPNFRLAALELVTQLWRNSQLNPGGGRGGRGGDQPQTPGGIVNSLPQVRTLLGIYGAIVSDHPVIA